MLKGLDELPRELGNSMSSLSGCTLIHVPSTHGNFTVNVSSRRDQIVLHRAYHFSYAANDVGWALMCGMYFDNDCLTVVQRLFAGVHDLAFNTKEDWSGAWEFGYPHRTILLGFGMETMLSGLWSNAERREHDALFMDDVPLYNLQGV